MPTALEKMDIPLQQIYSGYRQVRSEDKAKAGSKHPSLPEEGEPLFVSISYEGNSLNVSAPGFTILHDNADGSAMATILPDNVEGLTGEPQITKMRFGQSYQRTRWNNGKVYVWLGMRPLHHRGMKTAYYT